MTSKIQSGTLLPTLRRTYTTSNLMKTFTELPHEPLHKMSASELTGNRRRYHNGTWTPDTVFVFGSNLLGIHGGGAARFAYDNCGAWWKVGQGLTHSYRGDLQLTVCSYALPTVAKIGTPLPLDGVKAAVDLFKLYAVVRDDLTFFVTPVGCGLAGFTHEQIAPFFKDAPDNCLMPLEWKEILES